MATQAQQPRQREGLAGRDRTAPWVSRDPLMLGGVLVVTALVCLRSLGNNFVLDDEYNITANRFIGQWSFLSKALYRDTFWFLDPKLRWFSAYYRPVWLYWYWLNYRLFGLHPAGWHVTTILVHLTAVWLVYRIVRALTGEVDSALLAALLFGLLPAHADVLSFSASVDMALVATLELAAFYLFIARGNPARSISPSAVLVYGFALLAHESAVTFPGLIAAYVFFLESPAGERTLRTRVRLMTFRLAPFAAEAVLYLILHKLVVGAISRPMPGDHLTYGQTLMSMPGALAIYLRVLVLPWGAGPAHRLLPPTGIASSDFWIPAAMLVLVGAASVLAAMHSRRGQLYLFCSAWIAISIAPAMNLHAFRPDMIVQDRYLYLPSVGWCLMAATALAGFARSSSYRRLAWTGAAAWLIACSIGLWNAQHYWHDDFTLARIGNEEFPEAAVWHAKLSEALLEKEDIAGATRELEKWRSLTRDFHTLEGAKELQTLGLLHAQLGRNQEAQEELAQSLYLNPDATPIAYVTLARLYVMKGDLEAAASELGKELDRNPNDYGTLYALGRLHAQLGRTQDAAAEIGRALKLMPHPDPAAYASLAELYDLDGDEQNSEAALKTAESIPDAAEGAGIARARIRMRHGDKTGAEYVLRDVAGHYPDDQRVWTMLGLLLTDEKRGDEALVAYQHAIGLAPHDPRPYFYAAMQLHTQGRDREALDDCHRALAIDPNYADALSLMNGITRSSARH